MTELRGRRGFVLVLSILAVVVAGALIVATHVAVSLEHRVAANAIDRQRAFTASEYALWTAAATWDGANAALPRGGAATRVIHVLRDSATVTTVRLDHDLYWLVAEAEVGRARRRSGVNVKVTSDSTGTSVQPVRRSWVEVH